MQAIKEIWERLLKSPQIGSFLQDNLHTIKKIGILTGIAMILLVSFVAGRGGSELLEVTDDSIVAEQPVADKVIVDVGGAVKNPTVVELEDGSRVEDAIEAAGGLTDDANLTEINRAAFINDGDKIYIPGKSDTPGTVMVTPEGSGSVSSDGKVNINTSDSEQLQSLTGVGPATADKIIEYRESNGRFTSPQDITKVSGIGDKTYEKLKDSIRV